MQAGSFQQHEVGQKRQKKKDKYGFKVQVL